MHVGAAPGDVAALNSINIVVAAFIGRVVLKESLRGVYLAAMVFSVTGAVLVSQPEFIFGASLRSGAAWLGYVCAASSGFVHDCYFIIARCAADVSPWILTLSMVALCAILCALLPHTGIVQEAPLNVAFTSPLAAAGFTAIAFATTWCSASFLCAGSVLCPAAVSATVYTASSLAFGYIAQVVIFGLKPSVLTLVGAALMLVAVVLMAS